MVRNDSIAYTSDPLQYDYTCPKCGEKRIGTAEADNDIEEPIQESKDLKDAIARNAASEWCRCFKCDGLIRENHLQCDKKSLTTCLQWYHGYRTALLALGDDRLPELLESKTIKEE